MAIEFTHLKRAPKGRSPRDKPLYVSPLKGREDFLTSEKTNEAGRPHCYERPAVVYTDGYSVHAWHGVLVPEKWNTTPPSAREVLEWPNLEQRRVACERLGWDKIVDRLQTVIINRDTDPEIGELLSINMPDTGHQTFLRAKCGTGRDFILPVPPEMETAQEANAWTWGLEPSEYQPEVRT